MDGREIVVLDFAELQEASATEIDNLVSFQLLDRYIGNDLTEERL
jgi:hypothetical protein